MRHAYLLALVIAGCSTATTNENADSPANSKSEQPDLVEVEVPACVDDRTGAPMECETDADCTAGCPEFVCGYDPEGSHRSRTCLYAGGE